MLTSAFYRSHLSQKTRICCVCQEEAEEEEEEEEDHEKKKTMTTSICVWMSRLWCAEKRADSAHTAKLRTENSASRQ